MGRSRKGLNIDIATWEDFVAKWDEIKEFVKGKLK
jgi:hypothetical protein